MSDHTGDSVRNAAEDAVRAAAKDGARDATATRKRNSAQSRELLLVAATELFSERGYEGTTIREVGVRAGVDAALIARYFGSKAQLYLATLRIEEDHPGLNLPGNGGDSGDLPLHVADLERIRRLLERVQRTGATPSLYAAIRRHEDEQLQNAAAEVLDRRLVGPSERLAAAAGHQDARLRAEIAVAALAGVVLSRAAVSFDELSQAPSDDVARLVADMLNHLLSE